jgi:N-hydroxyarylamine O-acetyltransferase
VRPPVSDAAALKSLQRAHLLAIPFENLSIHLGETISLEEEALLEKLLVRGRGGFCYELNGAFALLLEELGFGVRRMSARVQGGDALGPPFDHLALLVTPTDGTGPWLADVGFGDHSHYPLLFEERRPQADPGGEFRLVDSEGDVDVIRDGELQYRVEVRPRALTDFVPTCWWQQTSPDSHFTKKTVCSRLTEEGRVTLSGRRLIETTGNERTETEFTDGELLDVYRDRFGILLERVPG